MKEILKYPHSILKTKCEEVDYESGRHIAEELLSTMHHSSDDRHVLGLAANQIGYLGRVFIADAKMMQTDAIHAVSIFINPKIVWRSEETEMMNEGCMSFPDTVLIPIKRHTSVQVAFTNKANKPELITFRGLRAQIVQHEIDHLDGRTLFQNATAKKQKFILKEIEKACRRSK